MIYISFCILIVDQVGLLFKYAQTQIHNFWPGVLKIQFYNAYIYTLKLNWPILTKNLLLFGTI